MRVTSTASAIRATMSPAEIGDLQLVIDYATSAGHYIPPRVPDLIAALGLAASDVRMKQAAKRAEKDYAKRVEQQRHEREHHSIVGDYSINASRADYADISSDPDWRHWVDLVLQEVMNKPIPPQCEIRRDVWCVRVVRLNRDALSDIVGSDCTETADTAEIRPLAEKLIACWEAQGRIAA